VDATPLPRSERIKRLLSNGDVRGWYETRDERTASTHRTQLEGLDLFLYRTGLNVPKLLKLAENRKRLKETVSKYIDAHVARGGRAVTSRGNWFAVKSFLKHCEIEVAWNPGLSRGELEADRTLSRRVPTVSELRHLQDKLPLRGRAIVQILISSGIRVGVLGTGFGADGLRIRDLPDYDVEARGFRVRPALVIVPARLSKGGFTYPTALSSEGCEVLESYLRERKDLTPDSLVIAPDPRGQKGKSPRLTKDGLEAMSRKGISSVVANGLKAVTPKGVRFTPHSLRAWASTQFERAENDGKISRTRRELLMGHSLGVDGKYNWDRAAVEQLEELRETYRRMEAYVSLSAVTQQDRASIDNLARIVASLLKERKDLDVPVERILSMDEKQLEELVGSVTPPKQERRALAPGPEADELLLAGWSSSQKLSDGRLLLVPPAD
jgi:integrase